MSDPSHDPGVDFVDRALALSRPPFGAIATEISNYQSRRMPAPPQVLRRAVAYLAALVNVFAPGGALATDLQRSGYLSAAAADRLAACAKDAQDACAVYAQMVADDATWQAKRTEYVNGVEQQVAQDMLKALSDNEGRFQTIMQQWPSGLDD